MESKNIVQWLKDHKHTQKWWASQIEKGIGRKVSKQMAHLIIQRKQRCPSDIAFETEDLTGGEVTARWLLLAPLPCDQESA